MNQLLEFLQEDGIEAEAKGADEWASPCPGCGGEDRFIIHPERNRYWCRQCGKHGDAIQYLRDFRGMSYQEAEGRAGKDMQTSSLALPHRTAQNAARAAKVLAPDSWKAQREKLLTEANRRLLNSPYVLARLQRERGLTRDSVARFRLGWQDRNLYPERVLWGLTPVLKDDGTPKKLCIPAGLVIPGPDRVRVRRSEPGKYGPYYVCPGSGSRPLLLGYDIPPEYAPLIVVESDLDAFLLWQEVGEADQGLHIMATGSVAHGPDADTVQEWRKRPLVLLALDADEAGYRAARKWEAMVQSPHCFPWPVPVGKDPGEAFLAGLDLRRWYLAGVQKLDL